jgi:hypothetical protein
MSESMMRIIFRPKEKDVTEEGRKLHRQQLHNIVRVIK